MDKGTFQDTEAGTPQGGIISPVLCNIALNGIEKAIHRAFPLKKGISAGIHVIRYADDMITTGKSVEILKEAKNIIKEFLADRGLELNENKTKITHVKEGFDFLGFNIVRKEYNPRLNSPTDQETVLIVKPSKKGVDNLKDKIKRIINKNNPIQQIV